MKNNSHGFCRRCKLIVYKGKGNFFKLDGRWWLFHEECCGKSLKSDYMNNQTDYSTDGIQIAETVNAFVRRSESVDIYSKIGEINGK